MCRERLKQEDRGVLWNTQNLDVCVCVCVVLGLCVYMFRLCSDKNHLNPGLLVCGYQTFLLATCQDELNQSERCLK